MSVILAVANQKGGVGKTTTAVNLAAGLALAGKKVLLADLDPQANATSGLGLDLHPDHRRHPLLASPGDDPIPAARPGLSVLPGSPELLRVEEALAPWENASRRLTQFLAGHRATDFIIIDCPPSLGILTRNALAGASGILIPIQCEYFAMEGLTRILRELETVRSSLNPGLKLAGILLTMYDPEVELADEVVREIQGTFPDSVYRTIIPRDATLSEASSFGQTVFEYAPRSRAALAYAELTLEVIINGQA